MPYALHTLSAPGTLVAGYRAGDPVDPAVIEAWGLIEGEDWSADRPGEQVAPVAVRPADDTDRAAWVSYATARGVDPDEADGMSLDDLMAVDAEQVQTGRPADSAKKAEWVLYVNSHPQATDEDKAWAGDDTTTKAELQAWEPVGDPVAVAATEQTNG